ncbi:MULTISPECIES: hypothetical protein [unclassified Streptomyces]|uniref:hypothetical protein n=1 Tax=unclassified Streptomyces TaxID=2593676 RepID=UPI00202E3B46|nr:MULTISPECIES: hypothetical protein [unclassified Streptomyces]MCM1971084.1 hypothetical protein [Streptomyces sp. G1]MCX5124203.1 hypothetical protein [Streptomyces sp. NBC_00347]
MSTDDQYGGGEVGGTGQTRTRFPEPSDPYAPPRRTSRGLITVVGVVVLLIAAIAFANQSRTPEDPPTADKPPTATNPTAATGIPPVDGKSAGIPKGFAQTEQGAQSAAANYAVALGSDGMFNATRRNAIVQAVYLPDVATARQGDLDRVYTDPEFLSRIGLDATGKAPKGLTFISRTNPVGTKAERFSAESASVSVWYSTLFGLAGEGSKNPVSESWYTNTFDLRWSGGEWRISSFTQKDGPAPVGRDQTAATAEEMAAAVSQFGGLTYAR